MLDQYSRKIDYIRISVTDRCNLRCVYCMPQDCGMQQERAETLSYEEIITLGKIFRRLGIRHVKLTGGEPLVRTQLERLVFRLKTECRMETVTLTTNGVFLAEQIDTLVQAGLDGVNISLDTLSAEHYARITGSDSFGQVLRGIEFAETYENLAVKLNCVLMHQTREELLALTEFARKNTSVRFIELMPIGQGKEKHTLREAEVRQLLAETYGTLKPVTVKCGSGPAHYVEIDGFAGKIGFISAISHKFCSGCNRVRLMSDGFLKPCLQYETGVDLRTLLRGGASEEELQNQIRETIWQKPKCHEFEKQNVTGQTERRSMFEIGG